MTIIAYYSGTIRKMFLAFLVLLTIPCLASSAFHAYDQRKLPPGISGPESFAFDCNRQGPYTGVSDGRIFKWEGLRRGWVQFAVTAPGRPSRICDRHIDPNLEPICGRPLGLQFDSSTCELYITDAYFGLQKVGKNGGTATTLASAANGVPFHFTNSLDIDYEAGVVYFSDSSTRFQRRQHLLIPATGDSTARLMKYEIASGKVTVLKDGLKYANGVALSKDKTYLLIAETGKSQILKYWLQGPRAKTTDVLCQLPGAPDNINRNSRGEFWVALNNGRTSPSYTDEIIAVRINGEGHILQSLHGDGILQGVSEVEENIGTLLVGSVGMGFVGISSVY